MGRFLRAILKAPRGFRAWRSSSFFGGIHVICEDRRQQSAALFRKGRCNGLLAKRGISIGTLVRTGGLEPPQTFVLRIFVPATAFTAAIRRLWSGLSLHLSAFAL